MPGRKQTATRGHQGSVISRSDFRDEIQLVVRIVPAVLVMLIISGCSFPKLSIPRVYKATVQQGNVLTQDMVDQLKPGMTHSQVAFIMGEPILRNTFTEDRWDYIYTIEVPGLFNQEVRMSLFFEEDLLAYFTGDMAPTQAQAQTAASGSSDEDS